MKIITIQIIVVCLCIWSQLIQAQDSILVHRYTDTLRVIDLSIPEDEEEFYFSRKREIGLDVTSLLAQLTPFNTVKAPKNIVGFKTKWYSKRYAFRMSFGFDLGNLVDETGFAYLSIGYERRKTLSRSFAYVSGWEGIFTTENDDDDFFIGVGNFHGVEYNINKSVFIGIETQIRVGYTLDGPEFRLLPPTAVYLNIRF